MSKVELLAPGEEDQINVYSGTNYVPTPWYCNLLKLPPDKLSEVLALFR